MESPITENEISGIVDQETLETPRAGTDDGNLVRRLLDEVSEIRKENQRLRSEVENIKAKTKRQLFQRSKDNDPECSVRKSALISICDRELKFELTDLVTASFKNELNLRTPSLQYWG